MSDSTPSNPSGLQPGPDTSREPVHPIVPLELEGEPLRRLINSAVDRICRYVETLPDQAARDLEGSAEIARAVTRPVPESGRDTDEVLDELFDRIVPKGFNTASPGYFAFIPGGGILHAAVADLISSAVNRYISVWQASPGLAQLEATVIRWFCEMVGYPADGRSGGILTTGGSMANLSAIVTARSSQLGEDFLDGVAYIADQAHHSIAKAAQIAGIPKANLRAVPSDGKLHIRVEELEREISKDRRAGRRPFLIVSSAGTTNTGAVDPSTELADLAEKEGLWLHVDAAYGGFFLLTERGRKVMRGIDRADSITLDPHKGLFLPYGTGCLLARDAEHLRKAHSVQADYMPAMQSDSGRVDFCELSPELSRGVRGLRIWLPVCLHGISAFRDQLDEKLDLTRFAYERVRAIPGVEIVAEPELSLFAFRLTKQDIDHDSTDRLNEEFLERINRNQRIFLTPTRINGRVVLRICILSFRSHLDRVKECLSTIEKAAAELL